MEEINQIIEINLFFKQKLSGKISKIFQFKQHAIFADVAIDQKGIGNGMPKINVQRRRTKDEIQVVKNLAIIKQQEIEQRLAEFN